MKKSFLFLFSFLFISTAGFGQATTIQGSLNEVLSMVRDLKNEMAEIKKTVNDQAKIIEDQKAKIVQLENNSSTGTLTRSPIAPDAPIALASRSQGFNPEIGVVGVIQANLVEPSTEDAEGLDSIAVKELELNFGANVDPFSRFDATITLNDDIEDETIEIEEAYYTHWGLPFGFTGRVGKFRPKVGKVNTKHLEQLETVNYPLVIQNFFGEEGMATSGARLQNSFSILDDIPVVITGEVLRGNNGDSFGGVSRRPIFNIHAESFLELSDSLHFNFGGNWMVGDQNSKGNAKGNDRFGTHILGAFGTFNWYLPEGRRVKWQNEFFIQDRTNSASLNSNPWGWYSLLDFKFAEKWSAGARFDQVEPRGLADVDRDTFGTQAYITFHQSEFAQFSLAFQHNSSADPDEEGENAVIFETTVLIGSHSHPVS